MALRTTRHFSLHMETDACSYLLEVELPIAIVYDGTFDDFRDTLLQHFIYNASSVRNNCFVNHMPHLFLAASWRLTLVSGDHNASFLSRMPLDTWFQGALNTCDACAHNHPGSTWTSYLGLQTDPVNAEKDDQTHWIGLYGATDKTNMSFWEEDACGVHFVSTTHLCEWDYVQIKHCCRTKATIDNDCALPTTCIKCPIKNKAIVAFSDRCIDWKRAKEELKKGYRRGIRYAWCGFHCANSNQTCGQKTYVAMSADEYKAIFDKDPLTGKLCDADYLNLLCNTAVA